MFWFLVTSALNFFAVDYYNFGFSRFDLPKSHLGNVSIFLCFPSFSFAFVSRTILLTFSLSPAV